RGDPVVRSWPLHGGISFKIEERQERKRAANLPGRIAGCRRGRGTPRRDCENNLRFGTCCFLLSLPEFLARLTNCQRSSGFPYLGMPHSIIFPEAVVHRNGAWNRRFRSRLAG